MILAQSLISPPCGRLASGSGPRPPADRGSRLSRAFPRSMVSGEMGRRLAILDDNDDFDDEPEAAA
jgi:hypothetical protein